MKRITIYNINEVVIKYTKERWSMKIYVFSDSFGETGEHLARCALSQFGIEDANLEKCPHINDISTLEYHLGKIVDEEDIIILHTIVELDVVERLKGFCKDRGIRSLDILNPFIDIIEDVMEKKPLRQAKAHRSLDEKYFKRIEAIEFAVKYDDGKDVRGMSEADIILVGISRTSKTPLSIYLGNNNKLKVTNIPLYPEGELPKEVYNTHSKKVIGLTNSVEMLNKIRTGRLKTIGCTRDNKYSDLGRIIEELDHADSVMKRIGCPVIDVSEKAIEETAELVLKIAREREII